MTEKRVLLIIYCALRKVGVDKKYFMPNAKIGVDFYFDDFDWLMFIYELEKIISYEIFDESIKHSTTIYDLVSGLKSSINCLQ